MSPLSLSVVSKLLSLTKYVILVLLLILCCLLSSTQDNCLLSVSSRYDSCGVFVTVCLMLPLRFLSNVHAFVSSRLDYCNSLFLACPKSVLDRLQRIQNAAARLILRTKRYDSATPMLQQLHWLRIPERIEFKSCLTTYKSLNKLAPSYLADFSIPLSSISLRNDLRSVASRKLNVRKCKTVSYGDKSYPVAGPRQWNALPTELRNSHSIDIIKRDLKTHLFKRSVHGLP